MSGKDEAVEELDKAVVALSQKAGEERVATYAADYALAVLHLAEARAWYHSVSQPHGGSQRVTS